MLNAVESLRAGHALLVGAYAAYALRFGATGLTFLDDEVTEVFSLHAEGRSVMFLTALGRAVV